MSLSKLSGVSRFGRSIFVRYLSSHDIPPELAVERVRNPYADPSRRRSAVSNVSHKIGTPLMETNEAVKPAVELEEPNIHKNNIVNSNAVEVEKKASQESPKPTTETDDFDVLKESLRKLEEAKAKNEALASEDSDHPSSSEEIEKRRKRMERNTRIGGMVVGSGSIIGLIAFCIYYGRAKRDEQGNIIHDEYSGNIFAPFLRIASSFKIWRDYVVEPAREKLLPDPLPAPYIQPKYTIVIELKNVLVHPEWTYNTGYRFLKRPALEYFLDVIGYPNFEVVIYTSESMMTAAPVVESFDPKQRIMYKLFRDCTKYTNGHHVKDLSKLNRDLSKVIFIDFDPKSGQLNPENLLRIPEWKGRMDDTTLVDLAELLKTIHLMEPDDVRPTLEYYSNYDDPTKEFRRRAIYLAEQEAQKQQSTEDQSLLKRYSGKLFGMRRHASV